MLARAARRKLRREALTSQTRLSEQLALPWLCPAQMRWTASTSPLKAAATSDTRPQTHSWKTASTRSQRHETRPLATAVEAQRGNTEPLSFNFAQAWEPRTPNPALAKLQKWDTTKPLIIHDATSSVMPSISAGSGIPGGNAIELHQNLYACLKVGRMDRAAIILQRLVTIYDALAPELIDAHNIYLKTMCDIALESKVGNGKEGQAALKEMQTWYEKHVVDRGLRPTAETFIPLLRGILNLTSGVERERLMREYLDMAHSHGGNIMEEINSSAEFTDEEWDTLIRFQPDEYDEPPSIDVLQDMQMSTPGGERLAIQQGLIPDASLNVKSVNQKGIGLSTLRQSLEALDTKGEIPFPHDMEGSQEVKERAYAYMRQIHVESEGAKAAVERWKAEDAKLQKIGIHGVLHSKPVQALMWQWYSAMLPLVKDEIKRVKEVLTAMDPTHNKQDPANHYGPWLEQSDPEKLTAITISSVLSSSTKNNQEHTALKVAYLTTTIGRQVQDEINQGLKQRHDRYVQKLRKHARAEALSKIAKEGDQKAANQDSDVPKTSAGALHSFNFREMGMPLAVKVKIGAILLELMTKSAMITITRDDPKTGKKLTNNQRAFQHQTGFVGGKKIGWIEPHYEIQEKLRNESVSNLHHIMLPMLVEPKPWTDFTDGGYYTIQEPVVRTKLADNEQASYARSAIANGDLEQMLAGLDVLGKLPWKINSDVFRVMVETWNKGEGIGGLVPEVMELQYPPEPPPDCTASTRREWIAAVKQYENTKSGFHSNRCFQNFQLEIARAFLNETVYFPHNLDFRGRAYPVPPILNHIGADISRGLLKFANGKELGEVGLQWLKIHLANLYGFDKASLRDREQFAMDNLDNIYDSATNPLGGKRWWTKAEDPWQCLACCFELKGALDSPDPAKFISTLPVHQDGTCNGLQHYAALGGDHAGAAQVNLEPSDRPQDIYSGVAELVNEMVTEDAKNGVPAGVILDGKITRKIVKRTVMTNVYGVTFMGAKLQVLDELKEVITDLKAVQSKSNGKIKTLHSLAIYVAKKIFLALGMIFNGAQEIQHWLGECGDRITCSLSPEQIRRLHDHANGVPAKVDARHSKTSRTWSRVEKKIIAEAGRFKTSIIWTTPLKMPVVQPYRKDPVEVIRTGLQRITVQKPSSAEPVNRRKQLQAFPPNFIHSLDATHMMLSALKCHEEGLAFAAVHDSFWTHAGDIPNLNIILRDAFVRMHSEDVIGRLAAEFETRYAGHLFVGSLHPSSPAATKIIAWRKKNRQGTKGKRQHYNEANAQELLLEQTRKDLLESDNEADRKRGEEMETPTSIWLANLDQDAMLGHRVSQSDSKAVSPSDEKKASDVPDQSLHAATEQENVEDQQEQDMAEEDALDLETGLKDSTKTRSPVARFFGIKVWMPLILPPLPQKGGWDVMRLKESKYFFS
ncbi:DNA-directed RNA polymerase mitochondrial precursor [Aaosphaeria arxii CBS 175.79]|uniref:DNA-directed RNA polymerase n=1 Tax=Aaosphaeria arxii CBS 175.79 TaxID=1450172 RepID=A0A6A5Y4G6_9PLEO|nr:DNA-directed RNA polymerase mitochondrial precursor [Aaosphaeria arxii CBS 175.79]KAF2020103.1 DNA-directed RNA polymerase mitochondrial precursor [Aaosphaeria arxii CBS 175.79]